MGKQKGGKGGGGAGRGGGGRGSSSKKKTVDAAALGLSGATPAPPMIPWSAGANPNPIGGMDPNMLSMMAMAGALGNGSQNVNVAFSQQQLAQMMQLVQAGTAAQQASADAAKAEEMEKAVAEATKEKSNKIAALEAKVNRKQKAAGSDRSEPDTEPDEGEDDDDGPVTKASRGQKRKAKQQNKLDLAQAAKAGLEVELARARAEAEVAKSKATQMETTISILREGGSIPRTRSASDGAIDIVEKINKAEQQAKVSTPVKQELQEIVAAQLAEIRKQPVSKLDLTKESPSSVASSKRIVRLAPAAKYKNMAARIEAKKGVVVPHDGNTDQTEAQSRVKKVMQVLDSSLAKLNKGKPLDTVAMPDEEDQEELEESVTVLMAPYEGLSKERYGAAATELVEGLGNKYGIHMESNCPQQFMNVVLYNMIWNEVYVEDEPMFAELQGFKAVKAVAVVTRKSKRTVGNMK